MNEIQHGLAPERTRLPRIRNWSRMQTRYVPSIAKAAFDEGLSRVADGVADTGGGSGFVIGVRNESGDLYREFLPSDPAAFVSLYDELEEMGFIDELEDDEGSRSAVFHQPTRGARRYRRRM